MSPTASPARPARQRKLTAKALEMLDMDEYVNSESDLIQSESEDADISSQGDIDAKYVAKAKQSSNNKMQSEEEVTDESEQEEETIPVNSKTAKSASPAKKNYIKKKASSKDEDMIDDVEVVITSSPKKGAHSGSVTPLASPLKKLTVKEVPKTPESPLKRKKAAQREPSMESTDDNYSHSEEEESDGAIVMTPKMQSRTSQAEKKRVSRGSPSPSPRKVSKVAPQIKTKKEMTALSSPAKTSKAKSAKVVKNAAADHNDDDDEGRPSTPRKRKEACIWTEQELQVIGRIFVQATLAVRPDTIQQGLEEVWEEDDSLRKTKQDIGSHLRKWKKYFESASSAINSS